MTPHQKALDICRAYQSQAKRRWEQMSQFRSAKPIPGPAERQLENLKTDYDQATEAVRFLETLRPFSSSAPSAASAVKPTHEKQPQSTRSPQSNHSPITNPH